MTKAFDIGEFADFVLAHGQSVSRESNPGATDIAPEYLAKCREKLVDALSLSPKEFSSRHDIGMDSALKEGGLYQYTLFTAYTIERFIPDQYIERFSNICETRTELSCRLTSAILSCMPMYYETTETEGKEKLLGWATQSEIIEQGLDNLDMSRRLDVTMGVCYTICLFIAKQDYGDDQEQLKLFNIEIIALLMRGLFLALIDQSLVEYESWIMQSAPPVVVDSLKRQIGKTLIAKAQQYPGVHVHFAASPQEFANKAVELHARHQHTTPGQSAPPAQPVA